ncbi:hypothetical protein [Corynebacterium glucuronolyticum]|uniref:Uncharacterized protein n=1 Tax=Corynebacterium glucuronolyticum TaxID=39791 RepID=A0AAX1L914_9CORY|nr:hypothetical protein [Corynebacterium glucuronolyticum]QRP70845.1 hypothetical protein I6J21_01325 [Corynebacterium glucuronolyticum]
MDTNTPPVGAEGVFVEFLDYGRRKALEFVAGHACRRFDQLPAYGIHFLPVGGIEGIAGARNDTQTRQRKIRRLLTLLGRGFSPGVGAGNKGADVFGEAVCGKREFLNFVLTQPTKPLEDSYPRGARGKELVWCHTH